MSATLDFFMTSGIVACVAGALCEGWRAVPKGLGQASPLAAQPRQFPQAILQRQRLDFLAERKAGRSRMDHEQAVQSEIGERGGHRLGHGRRISVFHFDPDALAAEEKQQIQLGPGLRAPVVSLAGAGMEQQLLDRERLPRCAEFRVAFERVDVGYAEQRVQEAGVAHVDLRRLDLALAKVFVPGLKNADRKSTRLNSSHGY